MGITCMECFQGRSSSVVPQRRLSFFLPLCLSYSHSTLPSLFVSVSFCGLQSRSWSQPCCVPVLVQRGAPGHLTPTRWRLESWGASLSSTPGHLTSPLGPDGVTTLFPPLLFQMNTQHQLEQPSPVLRLMFSPS